MVHINLGFIKLCANTVIEGVCGMENNLVENFLNFLQNDKKLSDNTLQSYNRDIKLYCNYLEENNLDMVKTDCDEIKDYLENLKEKGKAVSTVSRNLASLRSFINIYIELRL